MTSVAVCESPVGAARCEIDVVAAPANDPASAFRAVAYLVADGVGRGELVVNKHGRPLVAFARSPQEAAVYLASALKRRQLHAAKPP